MPIRQPNALKWGILSYNITPTPQHCPNIYFSALDVYMTIALSKNNF